MRLTETVIDSLAAVIPPVSLSSEEIESRLGPLYDRLKLPPGRLELMTGIARRHFWPRSMAASEAAARAGARALRRSGLDPGRIGLLVHCAVCRDRWEPATAAYVHRRLGLAGGVQIFDLSNACLGFLNGLAVASGLIDSGQVEAVLLVSGEDGRPLLEKTITTLLNEPMDRQSIKPYFANLTIGAGAVAAVLRRRSLPSGGALATPRAYVVETDSSHNELCQGGSAAGGGLEMATDSERLLEAGLAVAGRAWARFLERSGWGLDSIGRIITHQVGRTHQRRLLEALALPVSLDYPTYQWTGNVGSVSLPLTLADYCQRGGAQRGERVALLGIGSGLSSLMMGLEIEDPSRAEVHRETDSESNENGL